jgi:hypothetical protein
VADGAGGRGPESYDKNGTAVFELPIGGPRQWRRARDGPSSGRVQDAVSGRFISPDPNIPDPMNTGDYNRYSYVNSNPMTFTDPSGFDPTLAEVVVTPRSSSDSFTGGFDFFMDQGLYNYFDYYTAIDASAFGNPDGATILNDLLATVSLEVSLADQSSYLDSDPFGLSAPPSVWDNSADTVKAGIAGGAAGGVVGAIAGAAAGAAELAASAGAAPYLIGADGLLSGAAAAHAIPGGAFWGSAVGMASGIATGVSVYVLYTVITFTPPPSYYDNWEGLCGMFDMNNGC